MKILLVNTYSEGGAANSCIRLHRGLLAAGIESRLLFLHHTKGRSIPASFSFPFLDPDDIWRKRPEVQKKGMFSNFLGSKEGRLKKEIRILVPQKIEAFSFPDTGYDLTKDPNYEWADIINLHWVARFLDYDFFIKNKKPVVWTNHDMNAFTGGCHYAGACRAFESDCAKCVQLAESSDDTYSQRILKFKMENMKRVSRLTIVTPSKWLFGESKHSSLNRSFAHSVIPYGHNALHFFPQDRTQSRKSLNLPLDKKIILFVAFGTLNTKRKGFELLMKTFESLQRSDVALLAVGGNGSAHINDPRVIDFGFVDGDEKMSLLYSAADLFVIPSLEDNLPNTVIESLLCGTPVVGFHAGGIPDMVIEGKNGELAPVGNANTLKDKIGLVLDHAKRYDREKIREDAVARFDQQVQANAYIELFKEVLSTDKR